MLTVAPLREQEEQLKLMALHLRSERGGLLIVASPDNDAERALAEEVRLRVGGEVAVEEVTFESEPVERLSLSHHLSSLPTPSGKATVFVFGLDDLLLDARTTAINAMNWGRERLRWTGYSVVLWVRPGTPGELGNHAPDFFSWRSDVFEFELPTDPVDRQQALAQLRLFAPATLDELRQRYCDYIVRTCQWLDFRGLLQLRNVVRLPLDTVFVPLQATAASEHWLLPEPALSPPTSGPSDATEWRMPERPQLKRRFTLNEALRLHPNLVVLGDPGSGKSTLLRYLALTFAQGISRVQERLGTDDDRLPILVPLSAFAEARKRDPALPLVRFLSRYFVGQGLPDFSPLFEDTRLRGRVLVLLDGLDEMLTYDDRALTARAVVEFTNTCPTTRVIVTSRIAGYAPGMLPGSFPTFTLAPFDDDAIQRFARQWSLAFEAIGLPTPDLPPDARRRAMLRADQLATAVTGHPGVRRLATNPLMLTLLALIHHQGTRLPHRRVDLYRLCVEALAETWNLARSLTGRPVDLRLGDRRLDEAFVVRILAPVAYWMHESKPTGLVEREELEVHIAEQFVEREDASSDEAAALAHDFVDLAREQMGLLVERALDAFSFLHLSVQEYLAARFLSERMDAFERLKPRLHHPRWREVVLLTAGCLHGDFANAFVENILNAHSPYDDLLHRDLLLAAHCIGDDVPVLPKLRNQIRDALFDLWRHPPFSRLRGAITRTFVYLKGSVITPDVLDFLLRIIQDSDEDDRVRGDAAEPLGELGRGESEVTKTLLRIMHEDTLVHWSVVSALGQAGQREMEVIEALLHVVQDKSQGYLTRWIATSALGEADQCKAEVTTTLLRIVQDRNEAKEVRRDAAEALAQVRRGEAEVIKTLLHIVQDRREDRWIRGSAASALGKADQCKAEVTTTLLRIVQDRNEDDQVRSSTAKALGQVGRGESEITKVLLRVMQDRCEDPWVRGGAIEALEQVAQGEEEVVKTLLNILQDKDEDSLVRQSAAYALGQVGRSETRTTETLLRIVQDKNEDEKVRWSTQSALGQVGQGEEEVVRILLNIMRDKSEGKMTRWMAADVLAESAEAEVEVVQTLLQVADELALRDVALGALWDVLARGEGESANSVISSK